MTFASNSVTVSPSQIRGVYNKPNHTQQWVSIDNGGDIYIDQSKSRPLYYAKYCFLRFEPI